MNSINETQISEKEQIDFSSPLRDLELSSTNLEKNDNIKYTLQLDNISIIEDFQISPKSRIRKTSNLTNKSDELYIKNIVNTSVLIKTTATGLFKDGKYEEALKLYEKALEGLNIEEKYCSIINSNNFLNSKVDCLSNIAMCYLAMKKYQEAIKYSTEVLNIQSNNVRALYFRSKSNKRINNLNEAIQDLRHAIKIKSSKNMLMELKELEERISLLNKESKSTETKAETLNKDEVNENIINEVLKTETYQINRFEFENKEKSIFQKVIKLIKLILEFSLRNKKWIVIIMLLVLIKMKLHSWKKILKGIQFL